MTRLVVVGGGISGLAAAWYAAAAGASVTVLEATGAVGGKLRVAQVAGVPVDVGAEAMLVTRPEGIDLLTEAGLDDDRVDPLTTSAQIRAGGALHPMPARTMMGIPGDVEALQATGAVSREALQRVGDEPSLPPMQPLPHDVSVGSVVRARMGDEIADRLVEPLLGGVYAGRVDELSLQATIPKLAHRLERGGSLVEAVRALTGAGSAGGTRAPSQRKVFTSVRGGLGRLPQVLAESGRFTVRTSITVRAIRRTPNGFALECGAVPVAEQIEADAVIVAVPAPKAAKLLSDVAPTAGAELGRIETASTAIVTFALDPSVSLPAGSGLLVAAGERFATKGVTISSQKWPLDRSVTLLRASVGRAGETQALRLDDDELVAMVFRELKALLRIDTVPVDSLVTRWGGGLPQYAVGHVDRIQRVRADVAQVRGLAVCGAALDGLGIPACISTARAAVDRALAGRPAEGQ